MQIQENSSQYDLHEKRRKRKKLRARKRLMLFKRLTIFLLLVVILVLLALSSVFNIKSIEVVGNQHYKNEEITDVISLIKGNNAFKSLFYEYSSLDRLLKLRYGKSEDNIIKNYAYIKNVKVRHVILDKVVIDIIERIPYAVVIGKSSSVLIDSEGYVLEPVADNFDTGYMVINGMDFDSFELGQALSSDMGEAMKIYKSLIEAVEETDSKDDFKLQPVIKAVNLSDVRNVRLFLDSRVTVNIGDIRNMDDLIYRLNYLRQIFFKHLGNQSKGHIDFTISEKPRFIPQLN